MKSIVEHYLSFDEIMLPEQYRVVEIPSWEAVVAPVLQGVLQHFNQEFHEEKTELTDEMVVMLKIPEIATVHQLKQFAIDAFQAREKEAKFQHHIFPYLLVFFANTTQTIINEEEEHAYKIAMIENYQEDAEKAGISYEEFIQTSFGLNAMQTEELDERIHEFFVYKLIANARFGEHDQKLDETSYEEFIQKQVLDQMVDEIDIRERLPYVVYQDIFPEILLTEELKTYFKEQISFKIKN